MGLRLAIAEENVDFFPGLNGWFRWNAWAAHFFVDGVQSCNTQHAFAKGGIARGLPPVPPQPADLSAFGTPFGRVCARCLKAFRRTTQATEKP